MAKDKEIEKTVKLIRDFGKRIEGRRARLDADDKVTSGILQVAVILAEEVATFIEQEAKPV